MVPANRSLAGFFILNRTLTDVGTPAQIRTRSVIQLDCRTNGKRRNHVLCPQPTGLDPKVQLRQSIPVTVVFSMSLPLRITSARPHVMSDV